MVKEREVKRCELCDERLHKPVARGGNTLGLTWVCTTCWPMVAPIDPWKPIPVRPVRRVASPGRADRQYHGGMFGSGEW